MSSIEVLLFAEAILVLGSKINFMDRERGVPLEWANRPMPPLCRRISPCPVGSQGLRKWVKSRFCPPFVPWIGHTCSGVSGPGHHSLPSGLLQSFSNASPCLQSCSSVILSRHHGKIHLFKTCIRSFVFLIRILTSFLSYAHKTRMVPGPP